MNEELKQARKAFEVEEEKLATVEETMHVARRKANVPLLSSASSSLPFGNDLPFNLTASSHHRLSTKLTFSSLALRSPFPFSSSLFRNMLRLFSIVVQKLHRCGAFDDESDPCVAPLSLSQ